LSVELKDPEEFKKWLRNLDQDPITDILLKNSHLTKTQLETFLIDTIIPYLSGNKMITEEKTYFRIKGKISKGSFNRTLKQAQKNIIKSIYTFLLLGSLGIFDLPAFQQYIELSSRLKDYLDLHRQVREESSSSSDELQRAATIVSVREALEKALNTLTSPKSLKYQT